MYLAHYSDNKKGDDYFIGDIHGKFSTLYRHLRSLGFNESCDRLFALGDLVDRGPESEAVIDWLKEPWFVSIRGNHEQNAIDFYTGNKAECQYIFSGGGWFTSLCDQTQASLVQALCNLPMALEYHHESLTIGMVHAGVPEKDWKRFTRYLENLPECMYDLSARKASMFRKALTCREGFKSENPKPVQGIDLVLAGHNKVKEITAKANIIYMDTWSFTDGTGTIGLAKLQELSGMAVSLGNQG